MEQCLRWKKQFETRKVKDNYTQEWGGGEKETEGEPFFFSFLMNAPPQRCRSAATVKTLQRCRRSSPRRDEHRGVKKKRDGVKNGGSIGWKASMSVFGGSRLPRDSYRCIVSTTMGTLGVGYTRTRASAMHKGTYRSCKSTRFIFFITLISGKLC